MLCWCGDYMAHAEMGEAEAAEAAAPVPPQSDQIDMNNMEWLRCTLHEQVNTSTCMVTLRSAPL